MVTVVDQALSHIFGFNLRRVLDGPQVQDELMRAGAVLPLEQDGVVGFEARRHVVGVKNGAL